MQLENCDSPGAVGSEADSPREIAEVQIPHQRGRNQTPKGYPSRIRPSLPVYEKEGLVFRMVRERNPELIC